jgi:hypothetical protein
VKVRPSWALRLVLALLPRSQSVDTELESRRELCLREPQLLTLRVTPPGHALQSEKLLWRIRHQQNDLSYAALLCQHLCLSRIAQRKPATDWQNELAIAQVVCKFTYL